MITNLVNEHVLHQVLSSSPVAAIVDNFITSISQEMKDTMRAFINPLIVQLKNRVPSLTTTEATLNTNLFGILPAIRHMLSNYGSLIAENRKPQTHRSQLESSEDVSKSSSKTKEKGMFPNPSLQWRFIKIDGAFTSTLNLAVENDKMFLNVLYTDGYTCRVLFCRTVRPLLLTENVTLELENFGAEKDEHFRPCTADPGKKDVFVSYHRNNDLRRLSTKEYYNLGGTIRKQRKEQELKRRRLGVEEIKSNIPTPKTTSCEQYISYIKYMFQQMDVLFNFYSFRTVAIKWRNYVGSQKRIQDAVISF
ncbi:hypothetical protein [Parasitella parasitica]|uniref:Uncharacterized protein n=1 Tax=Parasitella parasitica TaxID=35722 RepID=A0A0B7NHA2_9FUNG|nr:hypothetical protein [Parasitella parasitica]